MSAVHGVVFTTERQEDARREIGWRRLPGPAAHTLPTPATAPQTFRRASGRRFDRGWGKGTVNLIGKGKTGEDEAWGEFIGLLKFSARGVKVSPRDTPTHARTHARACLRHALGCDAHLTDYACVGRSSRTRSKTCTATLLRRTSGSSTPGALHPHARRAQPPADAEGLHIRAHNWSL